MMIPLIGGPGDGGHVCVPDEDIWESVSIAANGERRKFNFDEDSNYLDMLETDGSKCPHIYRLETILEPGYGPELRYLYVGKK